MFLSKYLSSLALSLAAMMTVTKASDLSFRISMYDIKEQSIIDTELAAMDMTIPGTSINLKEFLVQNSVIDNEGNGNAVSAYHGFSRLDFIKGSEPLPCFEQSFGKDGEWTRKVCNAYNTAFDICTNYEASCESSKFPLIVAGKMSNLENSKKATAVLLCFYLNGIDNPFVCINPDQSIFDLVNLVFQITNNFVSGGYKNDILSNSRGMAIGLDGFSGFTDPDSHYVLGDGKISLYLQVLGLRKASMQTKYVSGPELLAFLTKYDVQSPLDQLHIDALGGYYSQKYSERFFTVSERKLFVNHSKFVFKTECGIVIGILATARCGFDAEDIGAFLEYYDSLLEGDYDNDSERYCSGVTKFHYRKARQYMITHNFDLSKKLTYKQCMIKIRLSTTMTKTVVGTYYDIGQLPSGGDI